MQTLKTWHFLRKATAADCIAIYTHTVGQTDYTDECLGDDKTKAFSVDWNELPMLTLNTYSRRTPTSTSSFASFEAVGWKHNLPYRSLTMVLRRKKTWTQYHSNGIQYWHLSNQWSGWWAEPPSAQDFWWQQWMLSKRHVRQTPAWQRTIGLQSS